MANDRLGIIAGGGELPGEVAAACRRAGRPYFLIRLKDMADAALAAEPGVDLALGELGAAVRRLRAEGCAAVCFAGNVQRPSFDSLKLDLKAMSVLPRILKAAAEGDDALLRAVLTVFEDEGFRIEGADQAGADTLDEGSVGRHAPSPGDLEDMRLALRVAHANGALDVGQGAIAANGLVLAVEAQEGTEAMLARCAGLPDHIRRGGPGRGGVLAKVPKTIQDRRVDLPAIGAATVEQAAAAGLSGIVGEAGGLLVVGRAAVIEAADRLGLFVVGVRPDAG